MHGKNSTRVNKRRVREVGPTSRLTPKKKGEGNAVVATLRWNSKSLQQLNPLKKGWGPRNLKFPPMPLLTNFLFLKIWKRRLISLVSLQKRKVERKSLQGSCQRHPTPLPCQLTAPIPHYTFPCWLPPKKTDGTPSLLIKTSMNIIPTHRAPIEKPHKHFHPHHPFLQTEKIPLPA